MHRARYCLGHTNEVIWPTCLGMDAGPKPRALHNSRKPAGKSGICELSCAGRSAPAHSWPLVTLGFLRFQNERRNA